MLIDPSEAIGCGHRRRAAAARHVNSRDVITFNQLLLLPLTPPLLLNSHVGRDYLFANCDREGHVWDRHSLSNCARYCTPLPSE